MSERDNISKKKKKKKKKGLVVARGSGMGI